MPVYSTVQGSASQGQTAYGATISFSFTSPVSFNNVLEVKTVDDKGYTTSDVDLTNLNSPDATEEMAPGLLKPGTLDLGCNFIGSTDQLAFKGWAQGQSVVWYQIQFGVQKNTKTCTEVGQCYVKTYDIGPLDPNRAVDIKISVQKTGPYSLTVA
jgi:hypothetical protein